MVVLYVALAIVTLSVYDFFGVLIAYMRKGETPEADSSIYTLQIILWPITLLFMGLEYIHTKGRKTVGRDRDCVRETKMQ